MTLQIVCFSFYTRVARSRSVILRVDLSQRQIEAAGTMKCNRNRRSDVTARILRFLLIFGDSAFLVALIKL